MERAEFETVVVYFFFRWPWQTTLLRMLLSMSCISGYLSSPIVNSVTGLTTETPNSTGQWWMMYIRTIPFVIEIVQGCLMDRMSSCVIHTAQFVSTDHFAVVLTPKALIPGIGTINRSAGLLFGSSDPEIGYRCYEQILNWIHKETPLKSTTSNDVVFSWSEFVYCHSIWENAQIGNVA